MESIVISLIMAQLILIPISYKWELNLKVVMLSGLAIGMFVGLVINIITIYFAITLLSKLIICFMLILCTSISALLIRFYRDPVRIAPERENILIAPADGTIKYIKPIKKGVIPFSSKGREKMQLTAPLVNILNEGEGYLIGIAMTFLDVHVTRAPINGKLTYFNHINGKFLSLKLEDALYKNERVIEIIENGRCKVGLIQIASRLVRRIVAYSKEGDELGLGQKIGMIKFGSQVDIVLPKLENLEVKVKVGDQVYAGTSIIAEM